MADHSCADRRHQPVATSAPVVRSRFRGQAGDLLEQHPNNPSEFRFRLRSRADEIAVNRRRTEVSMLPTAGFALNGHLTRAPDQRGQKGTAGFFATRQAVAEPKPLRIACDRESNRTAVASAMSDIARVRLFRSSVFRHLAYSAGDRVDMSLPRPCGKDIRRARMAC